MRPGFHKGDWSGFINAPDVCITIKLLDYSNRQAFMLAGGDTQGKFG